MSLPDDNSSAARLRSYIERIERVLEEIKGLQADVKEIKGEAKGAGFDVPTINAIIKLRAMDKADRDEKEALLDIYKAALGMLEDTPLGQAALDRLAKPPKAAKPEAGAASADNGNDSAEDGLAPPARSRPTSPAPESDTPSEPEPPKITIAAAREMGRQAALDGQPVTDNPFPARDPNRAAWDEAWCQTSGSDGMDLPDAWRRSKPTKKDAGRKGDE